MPPASIHAVVLSHAHLDHSGWLPALVKQGFKGPVYASPATRDLAQVLLLDSAHLQEEDARRTNRGGSGDLGRDDDLLMPPPTHIEHADVLLIESTYGNRLHPVEDVQARLGEIIRATTRRGGSVLLPSFAVGRAQALMLVLQRLKAAGEIDALLPVFLDSPMATAATALYQRHRRLLRIPGREAATLADGVTLVATPAESAGLTRSRWPKVVISASGMATGGRVLHHLKAMAPNPRNAIEFPGFQVGGTRGAALIAGACEVKIHGEYVAVKAQVSHLEGFSGHADGRSRWLTPAT